MILSGRGTPSLPDHRLTHDLSDTPRYAGVRLVDPSTGAVGAIEPVESGYGDQVTYMFRWSWVFDAFDATSGERLTE
jgi:hypothetical protein